MFLVRDGAETAWFKPCFSFTEWFGIRAGSSGAQFPHLYHREVDLIVSTILPALMSGNEKLRRVSSERPVCLGCSGPSPWCREFILDAVSSEMQGLKGSGCQFGVV